MANQLGLLDDPMRGNGCGGAGGGDGGGGVW